MTTEQDKGFRFVNNTLAREIGKEIESITYQSKEDYFNSSELSHTIGKFQLYFEAIVKENRELSFKLSKETSKRLLLESDLSVCKKELDAAVSRVLELSK